MHDIEPFYNWQNRYDSSDDNRSPFHGRSYSEFTFSNKIYNYFIHPQWDEFGSPTLYIKILFADYVKGFCVLEFIGEWNDCIHNDIMFLKREIVDVLMEHGINKFVLIGENVLNFHTDDDSYYEEWYEEVCDESGWICCLNFRKHVLDEMYDGRLQYYMHFGEQYNEVKWRTQRPEHLVLLLEKIIHNPPNPVLSSY